MRIANGFLPLSSKKRENRAAPTLCILSKGSILDSVLPKTSESVVSEVCSRRLVFRILEATNATSLRLAFPSRAGEEMAKLAIVMLD
jgi:hypothetical protein